ncbi:Intraflagellar transport protein 20 homolog [Geodia barretti]|uniref:Intraflagellar transport protein 20 homolog n=1 Tax=Geodia barretti TaxID=519541 RepID=A0AA35S6F0_GEOBA|nr:Intraflagellar transport protein 20 homolog [Geodia barretti]
MAVPAQPLPGYFYDELSKIRVLEPDTAQTTDELREECKDFVDRIGEFQSLVGSFIGMVDGLAQEVEKEKMKAIGARNLLKSIARERDSQKQQLQALLIEKKMELERLRVQYESLKQVEQDQQEITEDFGLK